MNSWGHAGNWGAGREVSAESMVFVLGLKLEWHFSRWRRGDGCCSLRAHREQRCMVSSGQSWDWLWLEWGAHLVSHRRSGWQGS